MDSMAASYREELAKSDAKRLDGAFITPTRGNTDTEYSIVGELPNVLAAVKRIFEEWPSLGYGTYVKYMTQLSDGSYGAQMGRHNSCE